MADVTVIPPTDYSGLSGLLLLGGPLWTDSFTVSGVAMTGHVKAPHVFVDMAFPVTTPALTGNTGTPVATGGSSVSTFGQTKLKAGAFTSTGLLESRGVTATAKVGTPLVVTQVAFQGSRDGQYRRWATMAYNKQVFFTNDLNPIAFTDGCYVYRYPGEQPSARYIETFFDHIILGCPTFKGVRYPSKVMWSDLYKFNIFEPAQTNEADSFDFVEQNTPGSPLIGVTGVGRIGDVCFIYLPDSIIRMRYVGKPKVMQWDVMPFNVGNSLAWGLVRDRNLHYFFNGTEMDFFVFNGEEVKSIGGAIKKFFVENIKPDYDSAQRTWGTLVPENYEVWWYYISRANPSNAVFDQAVVFNYKTGTWYTASSEGVQATLGSVIAPITTDRLTGVASDYTLVNSDQLSRNPYGFVPRIYVNAIGQIMRDETTADANNVVLASDKPVLITKDYYYDDLITIKEIDSMVAHSNMDVLVEIACRNHIDDPVNFQELGVYKAIEGIWKGKRQLTGRIFRWRFTPNTALSRSWRWTAFVEMVYRKLDEQ